MSIWAEALSDNKWLLGFAGLYSAAALAEGLYFGVPWSNLADVSRYVGLSLLMPVMVLAGAYAGGFFGFLAARPREGVIAAFLKLDALARNYLSGRRFAYAVLGVIAMQACNFFLVTKSMIFHANPFTKMQWDLSFAAWDKALHFGMYPHQFIIPLVNSLHLARVLDWAYFLWFAVMTAFAGYNLFYDRHLHRRLRYLWGYILCWALIGTLAATWLSSAGPVFFGAFYPEEGGPYDAIILNTKALLKEGSLFAEAARRMLLGWHRSKAMFDPNAISAMPSMHMAIAWLMVLYARLINRKVFIAASAFCLMIFLGSVYYGFHYAIDGYVAVALTSLIWWVTGKCLDRRYPRGARLQEDAS